jgi:hypothetical protein
MRIHKLMIVLLALLALATPAAAQEQELHWERFDIDVDVAPGGALRFSEEQDINIDAGTFRFGSRSFALRSGEEVRDVAVSEAGQPYRRSSSGEAPGTYQLIEGDGHFQIKYWFADTRASSHSMLITYSVLGALARQGSDQARLDWEFYGNSAFPIDTGELRITLPGRPDATEISFSNSGGVGTGGRLQGSSVVYSISDVEAKQQPLEASISFPRSILESGVALRDAPVREQPRNPAPPVAREPAARQPAPESSGGSGLMSLVCCLVLLFVMFSLITSFFRRAARGALMPPAQSGWGGYPQSGYGYPRRRSGLGGLGMLLPWLLTRPRSRYNNHPHNSPYNPGPGDQGGGGFSGGDWGGSSDSGGGGFSGGDWGGGGGSSDSGGGGFSGGDWGGGGGSSDSGGSGGSSDFG